MDCFNDVLTMFLCLDRGNIIAVYGRVRARSDFIQNILIFPVAQLVEHGASNTKIMGSIPRESKSW